MNSISKQGFSNFIYGDLVCFAVDEDHKLEILRTLGLEQTRTTTATSANTTAEQGYIEQLQERIKTQTELQKKINNNAQTRENPNGGGQARRDALTTDIEATQRQLEAALGQQNKAALTAENKLQAALKQLK